MLNKRMIPGLALGALLLAGGIALPDIALAHDGDRWDDGRRGEWRHDGRHDNGHHYGHYKWKHHRHWDRHYHGRYYYAPRAYYYAPAYGYYGEPRAGLTFIYRGHF